MCSAERLQAKGNSSGGLNSIVAEVYGLVECSQFATLISSIN